MRRPLLTTFFTLSFLNFFMAADAQNVGIGTNTPTQPLDVNGKMRVRGLSHTSKSQLVTVDSIGNLDLISLAADTVFSSATPTPLGSAASANAIDVVSHNNMAYVACLAADSILVFDCTNPQTPTLVSGVATGTGPRRLAVSDNRLYVANGGGTLQIFDCTNPSQLQLIGQANTAQLARGLGVYGNFIYVACGNSNVVQVFDCTNPSAPVLVGSVPTDSGPLKIEMVGSLLYLINLQGSSLQIFNCAVPASPTLLGETYVVQPHGLFVQDKLAYVTGANNRLQIFNCISPNTPVLAGVALTASDPRSVAVSGSIACVTNYGSRRLQVFDCSAPAMPALCGELTTANSPRSLVIKNNVVYVVSEFGRRLETFQLLKPGGVLVQNPNGSTAQVSPGHFFDNLGNHTATNNLSLGEYQLVGSGTSGLRISKDGGITIPTTLPGATLSFSEDVRNRKIALWDALNNDHQFLGFGVNARILRYQVGNADDDHVFYSGVSSTSSRELFRITGDGLVGIGTATPNALLQLANRLQNRSLVLWEGGANNHQFHGFGVNSGMMRYQVTNPSDAHVFYAGLSADSSRELVRINGEGNFGIGTSTPAEKLDVAGSARIDGTLVVDSLAQRSVQPITLTALWINYGGSFTPAGYYKDREGRVHLRGLIRGGMIIPGTVLFNLPVGFRPLAGRLIFTVDNAGSMGRIDILPNGDAVLMTANNNNHLNLTGISFRVD